MRGPLFRAALYRLGPEEHVLLLLQHHIVSDAWSVEVVLRELRTLYADLVKSTGDAPRWNFHKYLVDRSGRRVQSFGTKVEPNDAKLVGAIERLLEEAQ